MDYNISFYPKRYWKGWRKAIIFLIFIILLNRICYYSRISGILLLWRYNNVRVRVSRHQNSWTCAYLFFSPYFNWQICESFCVVWVAKHLWVLRSRFNIQLWQFPRWLLISHQFPCSFCEIIFHHLQMACCLGQFQQGINFARGSWKVGEKRIAKFRHLSGRDLCMNARACVYSLLWGRPWTRAREWQCVWLEQVQFAYSTELNPSLMCAYAWYLTGLPLLPALVLLLSRRAPELLHAWIEPAQATL